MAAKYTKLREMGAWGGHVATALTFLTTNWVLTLSALVGIATFVNEGLRAIALNPAVYAAVGAFLAVLWTIVGCTMLVDRRRPRKVQTHLDYRYGLTFEGFHPNFHSPNSGVPGAGDLQFLIAVRNFSPGPIQYRYEMLDIRVGTRASPKYIKDSITGYMARGAGRTSNGEAFPAADVAAFFGQGLIKGTADFSILYGPPDGAALRRLRISLEIGVSIPAGGNAGAGAPLVFLSKILSEVDEKI